MISRLRTTTVRWRVALFAVVLAGAAAIFPAVASAIVTDQPRIDVPIALDGEVWSVEQVGNFVVVGGNFTQVQVSRDGPIVDQAALFAYDLDTGVFVDSFRPEIGRIDGVPEIRDIQSTPDGSGLYIGGAFNTVADVPGGEVRNRNRIALLDSLTGRLDRNFARGGVNAQVNDLELDQWGRLYAGGNFTIGLDLSPDRPPIEHALRGIARFDAETAEFDTGFRYETQVDIGRPIAGNNTDRNFGVARVVLHPNGQDLYVAHRGAELHDAVSGEVFDSPGIASIRISQDSHSAVPYKALYPNQNGGNDPFYEAAQCGGRGVQIRDLDVTNGYLVVVQQGADSGFQCDTAVRFPATSGAHEPDWISRAFDSVFSVEIDGDDIYIGGHFRYLVSAAAPSAYPGATVLELSLIHI